MRGSDHCSSRYTLVDLIVRPPRDFRRDRRDCPQEVRDHAVGVVDGLRTLERQRARVQDRIRTAEGINEIHHAAEPLPDHMRD